jgi:hypothetical protein
MRRNNDVLWKGIIEEVFGDLLRFIFPKADQLFDMKRSFGFMDKELSELYPEPGKSSNTKYVDKLVKAYRLDGKEEWFLIHLEVQGRHEPGFPERMFRYYYRIFDRWRHPVTAIAICTGDDADKIPDRYEHSFLGTNLVYQYNTLRINGYSEDELASSKNLFAVVMQVAQKALLKGKISDLELAKQKWLIARSLLDRKGLSRRKIAAMMIFLDNYIHFKEPETNRIFRKRLDQKAGKKNIMDIFEQIKQIRIEETQEKAVKAFLENTEFSVEKIASLLDVSVTFVKKVKIELRRNKQ